jgi:hypothetical protein
MSGAMTRRLLLGTVFALGATPAWAQDTVVVIPAPVLKGAAANGPVVTQALRDALSRQGLSLVPAAKVEAALRKHGVNPRNPVPIATLQKVRASTGADYVAYARVLSVGVGMASLEFQATIILNVVGKSANAFKHTRQVGQPFDAKGARPETAVIGRDAAVAAARKLLEGFKR